jgi:hypothetical protein
MLRRSPDPLVVELPFALPASMPFELGFLLYPERDGAAPPAHRDTTVDVQLVETRGDGPVLDVELVWEFADARRRFRAWTTGTLDTRTSALRVAGRIADGWLRGAAVNATGPWPPADWRRYRASMRAVPTRAAA